MQKETSSQTSLGVKGLKHKTHESLHVLKCHQFQYRCKCSFYSLLRVHFLMQLRSEIWMQSKPYSSYSNIFHTHCNTCSSTAYHLWHKLMKFYHLRHVTCKCSTERDAVVHQPLCPWSHLLKGPHSPFKPGSRSASSAHATHSAVSLFF